MRKLLLVLLCFYLLSDIRSQTNTFTVTNNSDAVFPAPTNSLRWAIEQANLATGYSEIKFAIPGTAPHTITLVADLPSIQKQILIDGNTQPANGYTGSNKKIVLTYGTVTFPNAGLGLVLYTAGTNNSIVKNLHFNNFPGQALTLHNSNFVQVESNVFYGVPNPVNNWEIYLYYGSNHIVRNNIIGNPQSTASNSMECIAINEGSGGHLIGGLGPNEPNRFYNSSIIPGITLINCGVSTKMSGNLFTNTSPSLVGSGNISLGGVPCANLCKMYPLGITMSFINQTVFLSGTASPNDLVEIYLSNSTGLSPGSDALQLLGSTTANGAGLFNFVLNGYGIPGTIFNLIATDVNNNTSHFIKKAVSAACCTNFITCSKFKNFASTPTTGLYTANVCPNAALLFGISCAQPYTYNWDFGDGSPVVGSLGPVHTYTSAGTYTLKVTPTYTGATSVPCSILTQSISITVTPTACDPCCTNGFITTTGLQNVTNMGGVPGTYTATACNSMTFNASACSLTSPVYAWNFGEGPGTVSGASISHQYATAGTYVITALVGGLGCDAVTQTYSVTVSCCNTAIIGTSSGGCVNNPVSLGTDCTNPLATYNWSFGDGNTATGMPVSHVYSSPGTYNISLTILNPPSAPVTINSSINITTCPTVTACKDCIGSFSPEAGEYILSLWVREDNASAVKTYTNAGAKISFIGSTNSYGPFFPNLTKNKIIDGWQRIEEKFAVPAGATSIKIELLNASLSALDCYYDDIRIFPVNGNMKSYVYDPVTLRLAAELDENNYATFFEYDEDGKLIRVKKETERGIMTVKESRSSIKKQ